jgi:LEA14-like dessication related protein
VTTNLFTPSTLLIALPERTTDAEVREGSSMRTIVLLLLVVGVIGVLALVNNHQKQQAAPAPQSSAPVQRASLENVDLKVSWRKTSTNMMIATIAVTNRNNHDVKDLDVECTMYTPGGTALGEARRTVYDVVPARGDRTFRDFSMGTIHGQANAARCNVIGLANGADRPR